MCVFFVPCHNQHLNAIVGVLLDGMERSASSYTEQAGGGDDAMVWTIANRLETIGWLSKGIWKLTPEQVRFVYRHSVNGVRNIFPETLNPKP